MLPKYKVLREIAVCVNFGMKGTVERIKTVIFWVKKNIEFNTFSFRHDDNGQNIHLENIYTLHLA